MSNIQTSRKRLESGIVRYELWRDGEILVIEAYEERESARLVFSTLEDVVSGGDDTDFNTAVTAMEMLLLSMASQGVDISQAAIARALFDTLEGAANAY